jgi:hypothetical protein
VTIETKYNVGQEVLLYFQGYLVPKMIAGISTRATIDGVRIYYSFAGETDNKNYHEQDVYKSKDDFFSTISKRNSLKTI